VYLASFVHGVLNAQVYGVWRPLFFDTDPVVGGATGLVGLAVWGGLALWAWRRL
jgi:hypothetical protein